MYHIDNEIILCQFIASRCDALTTDVICELHRAAAHFIIIILTHPLFLTVLQNILLQILHTNTIRTSIFFLYFVRSFSFPESFYHLEKEFACNALHGFRGPVHDSNSRSICQPFGL